MYIQCQSIIEPISQRKSKFVDPARALAPFRIHYKLEPSTSSEKSLPVGTSDPLINAPSLNLAPCRHLARKTIMRSIYRYFVPIPPLTQARPCYNPYLRKANRTYKHRGAGGITLGRYVIRTSSYPHSTLTSRSPVDSEFP